MNVIVFGGSGFLGREIVKKLLMEKYKVKVVCQNVQKAKEILGSGVEVVFFDIFNKEALQKHLAGFDVVINSIGKLFERTQGEFYKFHTEFPMLLSQNCMGHLIHISSCGVGWSASVSKYAKTKLEGELNIKQHATSYNIISPSVMFGKNDNFFNQFAKMSKVSPVLPLIGGGKTLFQPIWVEDVAKAILVCCQKKENGKCYVACGKVMSFKEILQFVCSVKKIKRVLLPIPFYVAKVQAMFMNFFGIYALTKDQVNLLQINNIANEGDVSIDVIIGNIAKVEDIVPEYLK